MYYYLLFENILKNIFKLRVIMFIIDFSIKLVLMISVSEYFLEDYLSKIVK